VVEISAAASRNTLNSGKDSRESLNKSTHLA
jgi:hypothetical protein